MFASTLESLHINCGFGQLGMENFIFVQWMLENIENQNNFVVQNI